MIAHIYINGVIGTYFNGVEDVKGVNLIDVVTQVQKQPNAERYLVHINSPGGLCEVGHAIYNYLISLDKPVDTIAETMCASMGTIILMAGQNRTGISPLEFLVHNPWMSGIEGDHEDLLKAADEIKVEEDKAINIYHKITGISKDGLDLIMKENKIMTAEQAHELGFLTAVQTSSAQPTTGLKAVAILKSKTQNQMSNDKLDLVSKVVNGIKSLLVKANVIKSLLVTTDAGVSLEVWNPDMTEAGEVVPGNLVMIDGAPAPDGEYKIPDLGISINVVLGAIESVKPIEDTEDTANELATLRKENEAIKAENTKLKAESERADALLKEVEQLKALVETFKGSFEPAGAQQGVMKKKNKEQMSIKELAQERKSVYKK